LFISTNAAGYIKEKRKDGLIALINDHHNGTLKPMEGSKIVILY
jgi:purine nucleoside phosphorylase